MTRLAQTLQILLAFSLIVYITFLSFSQVRGDAKAAAKAEAEVSSCQDYLEACVKILKHRAQDPIEPDNFQSSPAQPEAL
jgi:hypothetical protein